MKTDTQGLEKYAFESLPTRDWKFKTIFDDIVMCEYADTDSEGHIKRGSIYVSADHSRNIWRVARVIMRGDKVPDTVQVGDCVMFPADKGIPCVLKDNKQIIFLNIERIFGVVEPTA